MVENGGITRTHSLVSSRQAGICWSAPIAVGPSPNVARAKLASEKLWALQPLGVGRAYGWTFGEQVWDDADAHVVVGVALVHAPDAFLLRYGTL